MSCTFGLLDNKKCLCSTCEHKVQPKRRQQGVLHKKERQKIKRIKSFASCHKTDAVCLLINYSADLLLVIWGSQTGSGVLGQLWILTLNKDFYSRMCEETSQAPEAEQKQKYLHSIFYRPELKGPQASTYSRTVTHLMSRNLLVVMHSVSSCQYFFHANKASVYFLSYHNRISFP